MNWRIIQGAKIAKLSTSKALLGVSGMLESPYLIGMVLSGSDSSGESPKFRHLKNSFRFKIFRQVPARLTIGLGLGWLNSSDLKSRVLFVVLSIGRGLL